MAACKWALVARKIARKRPGAYAPGPVESQLQVESTVTVTVTLRLVRRPPGHGRGAPDSAFSRNSGLWWSGARAVLGLRLARARRGLTLPAGASSA